jgi:hypothetical protein
VGKLNWLSLFQSIKRATKMKSEITDQSPS